MFRPAVVAYLFTQLTVIYAKSECVIKIIYKANEAKELQRDTTDILWLKIENATQRQQSIPKDHKSELQTHVWYALKPNSNGIGFRFLDGVHMDEKLKDGISKYEKDYQFFITNCTSFFREGHENGDKKIPQMDPGACSPQNKGTHYPAADTTAADDDDDDDAADSRKKSQPSDVSTKNEKKLLLNNILEILLFLSVMLNSSLVTYVVVRRKRHQDKARPSDPMFAVRPFYANPTSAGEENMYEEIEEMPSLIQSPMVPVRRVGSVHESNNSLYSPLEEITTEENKANFAAPAENDVSVIASHSGYVNEGVFSVVIRKDLDGDDVSKVSCESRKSLGDEGCKSLGDEGCKSLGDESCKSLGNKGCKE